MSEKQFCGSAKIIETQYGEMTKVSFSEKDVEVLKNNLDNGWVNAVIKEKMNKQEGKPTHYLQVDTWKPQANAAQAAPAKDDDLPF